MSELLLYNTYQTLFFLPTWLRYSLYKLTLYTSVMLGEKIGFGKCNWQPTTNGLNVLQQRLLSDPPSPEHMCSLFPTGSLICTQLCWPLNTLLHAFLCPLRCSSLLVFCLTHEHLLPSAPWQRFLDSLSLMALESLSWAQINAQLCWIHPHESPYTFFFKYKKGTGWFSFPIINFSQHLSNHKYYKWKWKKSHFIDFRFVFSI